MATRRTPRHLRFPSNEAFDRERVPEAPTGGACRPDAAHSASPDDIPEPAPPPSAPDEPHEDFEVVLHLSPSRRGFEAGRRRIEVRASAIAAVRGSLLSW